MPKKKFFGEDEVKDEETTSNYGKDVAKKDWSLHQNKYHFIIKEGKPLPKGIPENLLEALKTEGVI